MTETKEKLVKTIVSNAVCEHCGKNIIKKVLPAICGRQIIRSQLCECQRKFNRKTEEEERIKEKNNKISRLLEQSRLSKRFNESSFKKIIKTQYNTNAVENLESFTENFDSEKSFMLTSKPGTGKTLIASATVRALLAKNKSAVFVIVPELLDKIRESYARDSETSESRILFGLKECDCLVLDDLGAENHSGNIDTDWATTKLFKIINSRYNEKKSTIFTTNENSQTLKKKLGERIVSRIFEMCRGNVYKFDGEKDWRI